MSIYQSVEDVKLTPYHSFYLKKDKRCVLVLKDINFPLRNGFCLFAVWTSVLEKKYKLYWFTFSFIHQHPSPIVLMWEAGGAIYISPGGCQISRHNNCWASDGLSSHTGDVIITTFVVVFQSQSQGKYVPVHFVFSHQPHPNPHRRRDHHNF